jgi:hypothetical protein
MNRDRGLKLAGRIASKALARQVIIFAHDLASESRPNISPELFVISLRDFFPE